MTKENTENIAEVTSTSSKPNSGDPDDSKCDIKNVKPATNVPVPGVILISISTHIYISTCCSAGGPGGGIASLLGSTASILGGSTFAKEEAKPKLALKPEDVDKYKAAFSDFDHNKDGHISTKELMFAFRRA